MGIEISRSAYMATTAIVCVAGVVATPAFAQTKSFDVPAQSATTGITELGRQADIQIVAARKDTKGKQVNAVRGDMTAEQALVVMLKGTGLVARRTGSQTYSVVSVGNDADTTATNPRYTNNEIIVTAQKREESVQDVPIAVTALSSAALDERKIESGSELLRAVPNVTFSKSNFSMYNFSIRGIGTKAISASSDPAVA
ncbi:secretin and TonB N-terminal domain-containing protein, partial [Parasphingorhabdus sp. JC815]|uniref:STN domain-containing protein n=1 Tax=Parasphingorhabdus sp. JC815 TaxID=3232140 RepID=UPI0034592349